MINPKLKRLTDSLERNENVEVKRSNSIVLDMIGSAKRVLDVGCATGELSRLLAGAGNRIVGIEIDANAAQEARPSCEEVIVGDLDARSLGELVGDKIFDIALFANVLEHLRDPWRVLDEARRFLAPGGYAVLSLPNVAHGSNRLAFLRGEFEGERGGPLDRYLRYFTLKSIHELCFRAGFRVVEIERTKAPLFAADGSAQKLKPADFEREIVRAIETDPEHDTIQYVIRAAPLSDDERLAELVDIAAQAELRSNDARSKLARAESELERLRQRAAEADERVAGESGARMERLTEVESALAAAGERVAAERARADLLAENIGLAHERVAEMERRSESLRSERDAAHAQTTALRAAVERANDELAAARASAASAAETYQAELQSLREARADWQARTAEAREALDEVNRERDRAFARGEAAEATCRRLQHELSEASGVSDDRAATIEDLRYELAREAAKLIDVVADRDRNRDAKDAQQSAAAAFYAYVEAELARTRREIVQVDAMIRQVQSSRWWLAKRALGKLRRIVVSKLRR